MSDIGACGVVIEDFLEYLNMKYYTEESLMVKSHIGFSMIMLKDLIELIEIKEDLPLDIYNDLEFIRFFKNESENMKLIIEELKKQ